MEDYSGLCMEVIELGREDVVAASGCPYDTPDYTGPEIPA